MKPHHDHSQVFRHQESSVYLPNYDQVEAMCVFVISVAMVTVVRK